MLNKTVEISRSFCSVMKVADRGHYRVHLLTLCQTNLVEMVVAPWSLEERKRRIRQKKSTNNQYTIRAWILF